MSAVNTLPLPPREYIQDGVPRFSLGVKLKRYESVFGFIMIPVMLIVLPFAIAIGLIIAGAASEGFSGNTSDWTRLLEDVNEPLLEFVNDFIVAGLLFAVLIKNYLSNSFKDFFRYKLLRPNIIFAALGIATVGEAIATFILMLTMGSATPGNEEAINDMFRQNPGLVFVLVVFFAPFSEELIFRGIIFGKIYEKSPVAAHIVNTIVFSLVHVGSFVLMEGISALPYIIVYMQMVFPLGYCYQKSRNIVPCMIVPMINTLMAALFMLVGIN